MKIITIDNEVWQAEGCPGVKIGSGWVGAKNELAKANNYLIEFTPLDSTGKPDPERKLFGESETPCDKTDIDELKQILIVEKNLKQGNR